MADRTVASFGGAILRGPSAARINGGDLCKPGMPIFIATAPPTISSETAVRPATFRYHEPRRGGTREVDAVSSLERRLREIFVRRSLLVLRRRSYGRRAGVGR